MDDLTLEKSKVCFHHMQEQDVWKPRFGRSHHRSYCLTRTLDKPAAAWHPSQLKLPSVVAVELYGLICRSLPVEPVELEIPLRHYYRSARPATVSARPEHCLGSGG